MTEQSEKHLQRLKALTSTLMEEKYRRGNEEHSGELEDVPDLVLIEEMVAEAIDQLHYSLTLRERWMKKQGPKRDYSWGSVDVPPQENID